MFRNFFTKKREIVIKKVKNLPEFKLTVTHWINNVLTKNEEFFDSFEEVKKEGDKKEGSIKIYKDNKLIHTQKNKDFRGHGHQISNGNHKGHDHDHDTYA